MKDIRSHVIRKQCASHKNRQPCFICGKHHSITEAHHVVPLKDVAFLLESWGNLEEPPIVWLCPNCHTYIHKLYDGTLPWNAFSIEELKIAFSLENLKQQYMNQQMKRSGVLHNG